MDPGFLISDVNLARNLQLKNFIFAKTSVFTGFLAFLPSLAAVSPSQASVSLSST
jgi:hypothetical protein